MTDEELEAELMKLTPEEREELLADLESKESGALAGQAVAKKIAGSAYAQKISPRAARVVSSSSKSKIQAILDRRLQLKVECTDTDGGEDYFLKGTVKGRHQINATSVPVGGIDLGNNFYLCPQVESNDACRIHVEITGGELLGDVVSYFDEDTSSIIGSCSDFYLKPGDTYTLGDVPNIDKKSDIGWTVKAVDCYVVENFCSVLNWGQKQYSVAESTIGLCQYGCSNGACLPSPFEGIAKETVVPIK